MYHFHFFRDFLFKIGLMRNIRFACRYSVTEIRCEVGIWIERGNDHHRCILFTYTGAVTEMALSPDSNSKMISGWKGNILCHTRIFLAFFVSFLSSRYIVLGCQDDRPDLRKNFEIWVILGDRVRKFLYKVTRLYLYALNVNVFV